MIASIIIRTKNERCGFEWVGCQEGLGGVRGEKPYSDYVAWKIPFLIKRKLEKISVMELTV